MSVDSWVAWSAVAKAVLWVALRAVPWVVLWAASRVGRLVGARVAL